MTTKAVVLLSGGQDSTTCLFWAKHVLKVDELHALSVFYGQRHVSELVAARQVAIAAGVTTHFNVRLDLFDGSTSALVDHSKPLTADGGVPDAAMPQGLPSSFVPGRNLLFLAAAAARAGAVGAQHIVTGVCQTDYSGYPDCRQQFITAMEEAIREAWPSSAPHPVVHAPLMNLTKAETVVLADTLPGCWDALALSLTCYRGLRPGCGTCASCDLRRKGFEQSPFLDPGLDAPLLNADGSTLS